MPKRKYTPKNRAKNASQTGRKKAKGAAVKLCARTPEGKAQRWELYKKRRQRLKLPIMPYSAWSNVYDSNMEKANKANKAVKAYRDQIGWGKTEVTVQIAPNISRRIDIADVDKKKGVEHKTGKCNMSESILWEIKRDEMLKAQGWKIRWYFEGTAAQSVLDELDVRGIPYSFKT